MMMMIVCLMRCALVRTFSLSVCFSVIAVILLTDTPGCWTIGYLRRNVHRYGIDAGDRETWKGSFYPRQLTRGSSPLLSSGNLGFFYE